MNSRDFFIKATRKMYRLISMRKIRIPLSLMDRNKANDIIYNLLLKNEPCMIARFGTTEIGCITNYLGQLKQQSISKRIFKYISDEGGLPWWNDAYPKIISTYSGVFPESIDILEKFSRLYLQIIPQIDILASFNYEERFMPLRKDIERIFLETLTPFFVENPWTKILKGKKVLIIHPFKNTILHQYENREKLFDNKLILPEFDIKIIKAIQSLNGENNGFVNWFEALDFLKKKISEEDFDICLLGCGAYGMPLAAYIKTLGKQAIHMGGQLQLLFGIIGSRWCDPKYGREYGISKNINMNYSSLFNEFWIRPFKEDTPSYSRKIENSCYW